MKDFTYDQELLRKLQLSELDMLVELDKLCRENNIKYIIDAGTLLGAVRHGGFIPWDDDIDIRMLREDYDKFCEVCKIQLDEKFFLQTYKTDPGYRWGYARILKNGTEYRRANHDEIKSRNGIFIDVFPNDNLPESGLGNKLCTSLSWLCRKALYSEVGRNQAQKPINRVGFRILDLFPKKWAHNTLEFLVHSFGEDYMTPPPESERIPRHLATYIKF